MRSGSNNIYISGWKMLGIILGLALIVFTLIGLAMWADATAHKKPAWTKEKKDDSNRVAPRKTTRRR